MAKNDVILVDGIIQERLRDQLPSKELDEVFEYFAFEQVLKDFDPSREEIEEGWVDGRDDGGIDGFYIFINGYMLKDPVTFPWPKRNAEIEIHIITCKHHDTFLQAPLNALLASLPELFDLSNEKADLAHKYSADLLGARDLLTSAYRRLSIARPTLSFRFSYVSRGDSTQVAHNIHTRAQQIVRVTEDFFSQSKASFEFTGAAELISLYRRSKSFSLDLRIIDGITTEPGSYVAIVRLDDYYRFVTDESGSLRRYLFDSNVRDYLGKNTVNEDISASLKDAKAPEFWWLNNGITILATGVTAGGKTLHLQDIQIVNGLQTTESIFRHFQSGSAVSSARGVLVKVVMSADSMVRDRIIRATNNQSLVEGASLHATDKIQRDIEEILEQDSWYYERRKNYYLNIGKPAARFVTPLYLAAGYVALVMKSPAIAGRLKSRFMRTQKGYSSVFSESVPLKTWVAIVEVLKRVEDALSEVRPTSIGQGERFLSRWRNLLALLVVSRKLGSFAFGTRDLIDLDPSTITQEIIIETWAAIESAKQTPIKEREYRHARFVLEACTFAANSYGITDLAVVGRQHVTSGQNRKSAIFGTPLDEEFVAKVNSLLPEQPWIPRIHIALAEQLKCDHRLVQSAITELVRRGDRLRQVDGKIVESQGNR